jgi:hypothetical protein
MEAPEALITLQQGHLPAVPPLLQLPTHLAQLLLFLLLSAGVKV